MGTQLVKEDIPDPFAEAVRELVYPANAEKDKVEFEVDGFDVEIRRQKTSANRDDQIVITVPSEEAEMKIREWYGHVDPDSNVNGFQATEITEEQVVLRIPRPVLLTESIA